MPMINYDWDNDGTSDIKTLQSFRLKIGVAELGVGNLIITVIKSTVILYIVYLAFKFLDRTEK